MTNTTKFAPVGPLPLLQLLHSMSCLGDYFLLQAHEVAGSASEYSKFFNGLERKFIILDNSTIELGSPAPLAMIEEANEAVGGADLVVLPDHQGDAEWTISASRVAADRWKGRGFKGFMVVPQGKTEIEWGQCVSGLIGIEGVKAVGVPRNYTNAFGSRLDAIRTLVGYIGLHLDVKIHMLGISKDLLDDVFCARMPCVYGWDSTLPCSMGVMFDQISLDHWQGYPAYNHAIRGIAYDYWEAVTGNLTFDQKIGIARNVESIRRWIGAEVLDHAQ